MINTNSKQKTTTTPVSQSESSIYLKRSELPKDVSSFRNDAGYISASSLNAWLKSHSYLSKSEINELIKQANITVIDTVNKSYDDDAINILNEKIMGINGEIIVIKSLLNSTDGKYIPASKENTFATKGDINTINNKITQVNNIVNNLPDFDKFVTLDDIDTQTSDEIATKEWVESKKYLTKHQNLDSYARWDNLPDFDLFVKKDELPITDLSGMASKEWVESRHYLTDHQSLAKYAMKKDLPIMEDYVRKDELNVPSIDNLASKEWVSSQGYLKEHQPLVKYAKKSDVQGWLLEYARKEDVPTKQSLDGYATESWVLSQGYLKNFPSLKNYAKKEDLPIMENYVRKDELPTTDISGLASREWVESQGYLKNHQQLKDYAKKSEIPNLNGYATEAWVQEQIEQIPGQSDLSGYVKQSELSSILSGYVKSNTLNRYAQKNDVYSKNHIDINFLNKKDAEKTYLKIEDAQSDYFTKSETLQKFLQIEDYRGLRDMINSKDIIKNAVIINDEYGSEEALLADLGNLQNGFYIVKHTDDSDNEEHSDMYVVNDHQLVGTIKDGVPQETVTPQELVWVWEG